MPFVDAYERGESTLGQRRALARIVSYALLSQPMAPEGDGAASAEWHGLDAIAGLLDFDDGSEGPCASVAADDFAADWDPGR